MVVAAERRAFEKIVVFDQSRFARNAKDCLVYFDRLNALGVGFHSVSDDFGEGDSAFLGIGVRALTDEMQSRSNAKHVARSMEANAHLGFWNGSTPPFGYETYAAEARGARVKKKLRENAVEAEIVRLIFDLYVNGDGKAGPMGVKSIVSRLNAQGLKAQRGGAFRVQFVGDILRNTAYIGEHFYGKNDSRRRVRRDPSEWIKVPIPVIVEPALFFAAQEKLDRQSPLKIAPRLVTSNVLLSQIACCGACGAPMRKHSAKSGRFAYYRCSKAMESGAAVCKGAAIGVGELDEMVLTAIEAEALKPDRIRRVLQTLAARASTSNAARIRRRADLDGERRKTERQIKTFYARLSDIDMEVDPTARQFLEGLRDRLMTLRVEIAALDRQINMPVALITKAEAEAFAAAVRSELRNPNSRQFARGYVKLFISGLTVSKDEIRIAGPEAAPAAQAAAFAAGARVPDFAQDWRTNDGETGHWEIKRLLGECRIERRVRSRASRRSSG